MSFSAEEGDDAIVYSSWLWFGGGGGLFSTSEIKLQDAVEQPRPRPSCRKLLSSPDPDQAAGGC